jgi:hypothetical protein
MATTYDLIALGNTLKKAGLDINTRIHDDIANLDMHQVQELSNKAQDLLIKSKTVFELATIQIADNAKNALDTLNKSSGDITEVIKTIKTVQTVIDITAKLVTVAGAVIAGDPLKIISSAEDIVSDAATVLNS